MLEGKYCAHCGQAIREGDRFCSGCAEPVPDRDILAVEQVVKPTKKSNVTPGQTLFLIIVGVAVFIVLAVFVILDEPKATATGALPNTDVGTESVSSVSREGVVVPIGVPAKSANWRIVVDRKTIITSEDIVGTIRAAGMFYVVFTTVTNIGTEGSTFGSWQFKLIDNIDREYSATEFELSNAGQKRSFLDPINPGIKVTAAVVFDVPHGAGIRRLQFSGSLFEPPALIDLF